MKFKSINKGPIILSLVIIFTFIAVVVGEFCQKNDAVSSEVDGVFYAQFIDIGQGDSTLLSTPTGEFMLIDTGPGKSEDTLVEYLDNAGVEVIEYLILTHPHEDHIGGTAALMDNFTVNKVIMPDVDTDTSSFRQTLEAIESEGCEIIISEPETTYRLGESTIEILGPLNTDVNELNNTSVVCKVTYGDCSFMFTGDMEADYEEELISEYPQEILACDVLKVGHHGSNTSSSDEFLDAVNPSLAVISCSDDNEYGHPHSEVKKRLKDKSITYKRTDEEGTVIIKCDGKTVELHNED